MKELTRKQKLAALAAFALLNLSQAMRLLMKHGSDVIFGLQGRTWAFGCLALCVVTLAVAVGAMLKQDKPQQ